MGSIMCGDINIGNGNIARALIDTDWISGVIDLQQIDAFNTLVTINLNLSNATEIQVGYLFGRKQKLILKKIKIKIQDLQWQIVESDNIKSCHDYLLPEKQPFDPFGIGVQTQV